MLESWRERGEDAIADIMAIYFRNTGGLRGRACANVMHGGGVPSDDNTAEALNKSAHKGVGPRHGTALH
jgi:hypothetical protein